MPVNYQPIVSELLLALRGGRTSAELSKFIGYKYNKISRWESGEKQLRWDEFCEYCKSLKIPISEVLLTIFQYDRPDPLAFLSHLFSNKFPLCSVQDLAEKLHRHPSAIRRYLEGRIFPDLEFVLAFIDLDADRLSFFLSAILPAGQLSSLHERIEPELKRAQTEAETPLAAAIESWLRTNPYMALEKHDDEFIAQRVGCEAGKVKYILAKMLDAGTLIRNENGKFTVNYNTVTVVGDGSRNFNRFWTERAALRYKDEEIVNRGPVRGKGSCRIVPVSQETSRQINEIIVRADAEIRMAIAKGESSYDDVRMIVLHTLSTCDY